jgi:hypothetical protein
MNMTQAERTQSELLAALVAVMGRVPPDLERADADMNRAMFQARAVIASASLPAAEASPFLGSRLSPR